MILNFDRGQEQSAEQMTQSLMESAQMAFDNLERKLGLSGSEAENKIAAVTKVVNQQVGKIEANYVAVKGELYASEARIVALESDNVLINDTLTSHNAVVENANVQDLVAGSINGSVIKDGTVVAKALSHEAVETISGIKVYYDAEEPAVTLEDGEYIDADGHVMRSGDTWYKTVFTDDDEDQNVLHVWDETQWKASDFDGKLIRANTITAQEIASDYAYAGTVRAQQVLFGTDSAEDGERTAEEVIKDIEQSTSDSLDEAKTNINAEIERLSSKYEEIDNKADIGSYDNQIADLLSKSIIAQGYGELRDGTIRLRNRDGVSGVYIDGNGVQLRTNNVTVAYIISDQTVGSALKVDKSIQSTIRLRTGDNVGTLAIVANKVGSHGHVTLKEVL